MMTATPSLEEESNDDTPEEKDKGDEEDLRMKIEANMNNKLFKKISGRRMDAN